MRPEYYAESSGASHKPVEQNAALAGQRVEPDAFMPGIIDEQISSLGISEQSIPDHTASGPYFVSPDLDKDARELLYAARDIELAQVVARRIKLGMFTMRKTREELDREIDVKARLYETQAGFIDQLQIEEWWARSPDIEEEELARNLAEYHIERERLHELHINEAFHQIRRFGILSKWNDKMSEWYVGLSREYQIGVAMGATAISAVAGGMTAWSSDALSPTVAVVSGGVLAGAKIYKAYNQARLGIYEEFAQKEESSGDKDEVDTRPIGGMRGRLGRVALNLVQRSKSGWDGFVQKISRRPKSTIAPVGELNVMSGGEGEYSEPSEVLQPPDQLHIEVMSRMERRRRERVERADKVNRRAKIAVIGAGVLVAVGIGSRFIDFGKITDWFNDRPPAGTPSPSQSPSPTSIASTPGTPDSSVGNADGSGLSPPAEESPQPPVTQPPTSEQPEYSFSALTVENGEGWYQTFSEMGITDASEQAELLYRVGPELAMHGWAYIMPDGSYGISEPGILPRQALDLIAGGRY
jgi:hypothetical protein